MTAAELIALLRKVPPDTRVMIAYDSMVCISDANEGGVWLGVTPEGPYHEPSHSAVFLCDASAGMEHDIDRYKATRLDAPT